VSVSKIQSVIAVELKEFEHYFDNALKSKVSLLDIVMKYIVRRKGKQMRPMFVLLSAGTNGTIADRTYRAASMIELLHTATLVHDDVVDDSYQRRGFWSINALWKNKIAVLVGDYLLSKGLLLAVDNGDFDMLQIVSNAVKRMSEGELLQIEKARRLDIDEAVYYDIIKGKTASLIATSCAIGAASVGADKETIQQFYQIGEDVGMAFQIKDDLFDYADADVGKPTHIDIKEKKMTLPLIYALQKADSKLRREMIQVVKRHNTDKKKVDWLIAKVIELGGMEYAKNKMNAFYQNALNAMATCPKNQYADSLTQLITYTIERTK
jgi:octaprenyl-diphosphate synthase